MLVYEIIWRQMVSLLVDYEYKHVGRSGYGLFCVFSRISFTGSENVNKLVSADKLWAVISTIPNTK
jgi:hypothetical protein